MAHEPEFGVPDKDSPELTGADFDSSRIWRSGDPVQTEAEVTLAGLRLTIERLIDAIKSRNAASPSDQRALGKARRALQALDDDAA